jgi:hypothetical protein
VLSGRGFCDGLIIRPEESYRMRRVVVCDQKTSKTTRRLKPATGLWKIQPRWVVTPRKQTNNRSHIKVCVIHTGQDTLMGFVINCGYLISLYITDSLKVGHNFVNRRRGDQPSYQKLTAQKKTHVAELCKSPAIDKAFAIYSCSKA